MQHSATPSGKDDDARLALLRVLADRLPAMLAYWDADLRCRYANNAYETWFGVKPETMIGRGMAEFLGPLFKLNLPYILGALRGEDQEFEREIPDPRGGPPRYSQASYLPDIKDGQVRGFCVLVVDITRRKLAEEALQVAERRLRAVERLTAIASLAAGLGHEINNPLTSILGNLELVLEQVGSASSARAALGSIPPSITSQLEAARDAAQHIAEIVQSMKLLARGETGETTAVELDTSIRQSVKLASATRYRASIQLDLQARGFVNANASQLAQIWVNLLANAAQAFREPFTANNLIVVRSLHRDDQLVVEVEDNGPGIPEALQGRIFEPFFTTRENSSGTGLGLSICRSIVNAYGGTITLESQEGRGSIFRVSLPAASAPPLPSLQPRASSEPRKAPVVSPLEAKPRVLVVDDEQGLRCLVELGLRDRYEIHSAASVSDALTLLARMDGQADIVLSDLMMPERGGADLYTEAVKRWPLLAERFVFMTGGAFTPEGRAFLARASAPVLDKPFSMQALRALIASRLPARD